MVFIVICLPWLATAQLERVTNQARGEGKPALERECEREENLKGLLKERDNALEKLVRNREGLERLKVEMKDQVKAWEEKERDWEEKRMSEEKIHEEDTRSLEIGRNKERENWNGQVERLEMEKREDKYRMDRGIKRILGEREQERMRWVKNKEGWGKEKEGGTK